MDQGNTKTIPPVSTGQRIALLGSLVVVATMVVLGYEWGGMGVAIGNLIGFVGIAVSFEVVLRRRLPSV
ncbi:MAG: hypothetical protein MK074_00890 [Phycisphaerales bacterium]|nr:hypothetical protein [Phycisphaerales bacterium]